MDPSELIRERNMAFSRGDFGFIFDSYHSGSNFRRQFPSREEYLQVGKATLSEAYTIVDCSVLDERIEGSNAQVIYVMEMEAQGQLQKFAELTWLKTEKGGWKYHRGLKITQNDLPDDHSELTFEFFARFDQSAVF